MLGIIIVLLVIFWLLGFVPIGIIPAITLFSLNGHPITLWNLIVFGLIAGALGILPSPFREIAGVALIIWVLSLLGIIAIAGLSNIIVIAIIIGLILALFGGI